MLLCQVQLPLGYKVNPLPANELLNLSLSGAKSLNQATLLEVKLPALRATKPTGQACRMQPDRVWSRQQLFEQLWEPDFTGISKNVDVHIRHLREKLELRPRRPKYITTVPKVGYRFG